MHARFSATAPRARRFPPWRRLMVQGHRWLGLAAGLLWLLQAVSGTLIVFHWETDDLLLHGPRAATDLRAIQARLGTLAPAGSGRRIASVWTSAGLPDRYDVTVEDSRNGEQAIRIAGDGTVLRTLPDGARSVMDTIVVLHQTLLAGPTGSWIIGISGMLLLTNLILGLTVAWPRRGQWRRSLSPARTGPAVARFYSWHRALGLWIMVPATILIAAGTILVFEGGARNVLGGEAPTLPAVPATGPATGPFIGFAPAVTTALQALPGSRLTAVTLPGPDDATYVVRVLAPDEIRRAYGTSMVMVDARDGHIRGVFPARDARPATAFMDALYAVHTGELFGLGGRLLVLATGLWLATMIVIGALLWQKRRRPSGTRNRGK